MGAKMKTQKKYISQVVSIGILLSLFYIIPTTLCESDVTESHVSPNDKSATTMSSVPLDSQKNVQSVETPVTKKKEPDSAKTPSDTDPAIAINTKKDVEKKDGSDTDELTTPKTPVFSKELDSGAVKRAFFVFVGLSLIVVAYLVVRSFRLRSSPAQMVRKYGVLAHKQDIEMRPLPLDDDDDDDTTVFDASKLPLHSHQIA